MSSKNFKEVSKEWLEVKRFSVKYPTYDKYKKVIHRQLRNYFREYSMDQIDDELIINFFNQLHSENNYASSTIQTINYVLKAIVGYSHEKYQTKLYDFKFIKISKAAKRLTVLTPSQKLNLCNYCFNHYDAISVAICISLYGGLRIGEICALKWEDFDFKENCINVDKTVERLTNTVESSDKTALMILEPKTLTSKRIIPMPVFLVEYLKKYKTINNIQALDNYVITGNGKIPDPRTTQYRFTKLCKQFDFHINFHALRHSFATNCVMNDVDTKSLSEILGHSNVGITLNLYVHSSLEFKKQQMNKIPRP